MMGFSYVKFLNPTGVSKNHLDLQSDFKDSLSTMPARPTAAVQEEFIYLSTSF
jgi:hypothetical protein